MDKIKCRKWLFNFGLLLVVFVLIISLITYLVDPFFQFCVRDNEYMLNDTYVTPGLVKNYDYNTVIVGSSMTKNFDMDYMAEQLNCKSVKASINSMSAVEMEKMLELIHKTGKANTCYVCLDLISLTKDGEMHCPDYLYEEGLIPFLEYSFSYESWLRYIPIDVALKIVNMTGIGIPESISKECSVKRLGYWGDDYSYSEEQVIKKYKNSKYALSTVDTNNLQERMQGIIDRLFETIKSEECEYNFFFPPYSSLFWYNAQTNGYFDTFMWAKSYIYQKAEKIGCKVYDFQSAEFTTDLNNYRDTTHYKPEINDWMVDCFSNGNFMVTAQNCNEMIDTLKNNTSGFVKNNSHIIN